MKGGLATKIDLAQQALVYLHHGVMTIPCFSFTAADAALATRSRDQGEYDVSFQILS